MYRLFTLSTLVLVVVSLPKRPRIYNVLISTKKNLSPSHAIPVYEPVLRTTSLGVAFPPLVYHNQGVLQPNIHVPVLHGGPVLQEVQQPVNLNQNVPANVQSFYRYNSPYVQPYYQQKNPEVKIEHANVEPNRNFGKYYENVNDPKRIVANLKENPDIPDVPPPALPVKNLESQ